LHAEEEVKVTIPTGALFPIPIEARQVLDRRCVMCHGGRIHGEIVTMEDINFTSDKKIRETLESADLLITAIRDDDMPQGAKLPRNFRSDPALSAELGQLKVDYETKKEKAILMEWLDGVATPAN